MARLDRLGQQKRSHRSEQQSGESSLIHFWSAVARKSKSELASALDRILQAGLLFHQGFRPTHPIYLNMHWCRMPRTAHCCVSRDARFTLVSLKYWKASSLTLPQAQPELLARHCTEAGLTAKAAGFWGKAGQRSMERSALFEAAEQFTRALEQMEALPATASLTREQIKLQVALVGALLHIKGAPALETKFAMEKARLLIEQAEARGEPPEDPLLLFSVLYSFWLVNYVAFKGDALLDLRHSSWQSLRSKEQQSHL